MYSIDIVLSPSIRWLHNLSSEKIGLLFAKLIYILHMYLPAAKEYH